MVSPVSWVVTVLMFIAFMVLLLLQRISVGGAAQVTGQLPLSPVVFWLLASSLARRPTEPCLPAGQGAGNSWRKSATQERRREIPAQQAPVELAEPGLGGPEPCDGQHWTPQPAAPADARKHCPWTRGDRPTHGEGVAGCPSWTGGCG